MWILLIFDFIIEIAAISLGGSTLREDGFSFISSWSSSSNVNPCVVKRIGDFNGDGFEDIAVGLPSDGMSVEYSCAV